MKPLPAVVAAYRRTPAFTTETVPAALTEAHTTKAGVWGLIVVSQGRLRYDILTDGESHVLAPGWPGVVEPEVQHRVTPLGPVRFHVSFYR